MNGAALRCTCPRCHGKVYSDVSEYVADHQGVEVLPSEVGLLKPRYLTQQIYVADTGLGRDQMLVYVYPEDRVAEVSFRQDHHHTWSAPVMMRAE